MTRVAVLSESSAPDLAFQVELWGHLVVAQLGDASELVRLPHDIEAVLVDGLPDRLDRDLVDQRQYRMIAVIDRPEQHVRAIGLGIETVSRAELEEQLPQLLAGAMLSNVGTRGPGRVVVVWGAPGAPGTSTLAVNLVAELASTRGKRGATNVQRICLIDMDCWAPSIAAILGRVAEIPGVAAAARLAERDELSEAELGRLSVAGPGGSWVLSGLAALDRWPELSAARVSALIAAIRGWFDLVVIDVGAHSPADESVADPLAPHRTAAAQAACEAADLLIGVGAADPIGLARLVRAWPNWQRPGQASLLVVNQLRARVLGAAPGTQVRRACEQFLGVTPAAILPHDPAAADTALCAARPLRDSAARSGLRTAIREFAEHWVGTMSAQPAPEAALR